MLMATRLAASTILRIPSTRIIRSDCTGHRRHLPFARLPCGCVDGRQIKLGVNHTRAKSRSVPRTGTKSATVPTDSSAAPGLHKRSFLQARSKPPPAGQLRTHPAISDRDIYILL